MKSKRSLMFFVVICITIVGFSFIMSLTKKNNKFCNYSLDDILNGAIPTGEKLFVIVADPVMTIE